MSADRSAPCPARPVPAAVQVLSVLVFGAFAITAVSIAFAQFWPAGVALAALLAWRGDFLPAAVRSQPAPADRDAPAEAPAARSSGNAAFNSYRDDMLSRLEDEQARFEEFLARLRAARDKTEFDSFMDDRAARLHGDSAARLAG